MSLYFLAHEAEALQQMTSLLGVSRRKRSFEPCVELCHDLLRAVCEFHSRYHLGADESIARRIINGLPYDRHCWKLLVGEALLYGAVDVPEFETLPQTLNLLISSEQGHTADGLRVGLPPVLQAHYGSRDLE